MKYVNIMNNWILGCSKTGKKRKKIRIRKEKIWKGWILFSVNVYYLSSHKHEITDMMDLITKPPESKYLEKIKLTSYEERKIDVWEQSRSHTVLLAAWPWENYLAFLTFRFLICGKELTMISLYGNFDKYVIIIIPGS